MMEPRRPDSQIEPSSPYLQLCIAHLELVSWEGCQAFHLQWKLLLYKLSAVFYNGSEKMGEFCNLCKIVLLLILPLFREKSN